MLNLVQAQETIQTQASGQKMAEIYIFFFYTGLWETSKAFSHHNKSCITVFDLRLDVKNQDILGIYFDIL